MLKVLNCDRGEARASLRRLVLHGKPGRPPGLHSALQIEDVLHPQRRGHFSGDCAALTNLAHEDHVVRRDRVLRLGNDLTERRQPGAGNVVAGVLPLFADVDDLELATRDPLVDFFGTESAEWFGGRVL